MATIDAGESDTPWGEHIDATHITGDLWFVDRWASWHWYLAGALCLLVPPAGVFLLVYFASASIYTADDDIPLTAE